MYLFSCDYRINNINVEIRFQIHAWRRCRGLGAEGSPIFSDSSLYLLKTIVDLYKILMLAFISIKPPKL